MNFTRAFVSVSFGGKLGALSDKSHTHLPVVPTSVALDEAGQGLAIQRLEFFFNRAQVDLNNETTRWP